MRRRPSFRLLASILGLWLPLFIGEPSLLSPCHMHGVFAASSAPAGAAHSHGHMDASRSSSSHTPAQHDETHCSCVGCCTTSVARVSVADAAVVTFVVGVQRQTTGVAAAGVRAAQSPEFSRPYPTGPPRA